MTEFINKLCLSNLIKCFFFIIVTMKFYLLVSLILIAGFVPNEVDSIYSIFGRVGGGAGGFSPSDDRCSCCYDRVRRFGCCVPTCADY